MYQQNHVGVHRSDDGGHSWLEITEGLPSEFGFAAAAHPYDRDAFYVIPLDPGHGRCMPDGRAAVFGDPAPVRLREERDFGCEPCCQRRRNFGRLRS